MFPSSRLNVSEYQNDGKPEPIPTLVAANGSKILTFGRREMTLCLFNKNYTWDFIIADIQQPLLGADFLGNFRLLVDVAGQRLFNMESFSSMPLFPVNTVGTFSIETTNQYSYLFNQYKDVFKAELKQNPNIVSKHGIYHYISTSGPPLHSRYRRLPPKKLEAAKAAFMEMEKMGICKKASSPWSSPLHMVPKPDGTWRPCGDYRRLNLQTKPDHYPLPNIQDIMSLVHGAKIFSKLDLLKGYFQVPVNPEDVDKTCIVTPFGSYVFFYSTFGLRNAGATFQRLMDTIFGHIPFCIVYTDDILVFSETVSDHHTHLQEVLDLLQQNGLVVRPDKCIFGASTLSFLGHRIDKHGVYPTDEKIKAVKDYPQPTSNKELQRYLGLVNYYHRFIPHYAEILRPLYELLKGRPKEFTWGADQENAFNRSKSELASSTCLHHPNPNARIILTTDASSTAVGAVLEQVVNNCIQPLAFFSKQLRPNERNYSTFDRELLAVYLALRHFKYYLEGIEFKVKTDHRPLLTALTKKSEAFSSRQQRQLSAISEFSCQLEYIPGGNNPAADALSRATINPIQIGIDYRELALQQLSDPDIKNSKNLFSSLILENIQFDNETFILCDTSTGKPRPIVPLNLRKKIFEMIHGLTHPSIRSSVRLITEKFVWHGISRDIRSWARTCDKCQRSKIHRHVESGIGSYATPRRRFCHIHVDIVGPLPVSNGYRYLFTIIDRSTRWPEAVPLEEANAASCAYALLDRWISRFGVPHDITSDRGSTFISELWKSLAGIMGSRVHYTTAYNPESNGIIERLHRTLKQSLIARCIFSDWFYQLPWILLGMRTMPKVDIGSSPAEMVYGETIVVPGEFFPCESNSESMELRRARNAASHFKPVPPRHNTRNIHVPNVIKTCEYVFMRDDSYRPPLTAPYKGPFKVMQRSEKAFKIQLASGKTDWVSIDRLKPAYLDSDISSPCSSFGRPLRPPDYYLS